MKIHARACGTRVREVHTTTAREAGKCAGVRWLGGWAVDGPAETMANGRHNAEPISLCVDKRTPGDGDVKHNMCNTRGTY